MRLLLRLMKKIHQFIFRNILISYVFLICIVMDQRSANRLMPFFFCVSCAEWDFGEKRNLIGLFDLLMSMQLVWYIECWISVQFCLVPFMYSPKENKTLFYILLLC